MEVRYSPFQYAYVCVLEKIMKMTKYENDYA